MAVISVIRSTGLLMQADVAAFCSACQKALDQHFGLAWGVTATIVPIEPGEVIPAGSWQVHLVNNSTEASALGFHDASGPGASPEAFVAVEDDQKDGTSWQVTASHEIWEMLADPYITGVVQMTNGAGVSYTIAMECADACEDDQFAFEIDGIKISAFMTRAWFDPKGVAPFTYPAILAINAPFTQADGGYISKRRLPDGQWTQDFAARMGPRCRPKAASSRTMRRFNAL